MSTVYLGHRLCNLILPEEPESIFISTPSGTWNLRRYFDYSQSRKAVISEGKCAITYDISSSVAFSGSRAEAMDGRHRELLPICLGASYLTANAVRPVQDLPGSEVMFLSVGDHFPRERSMYTGLQMATRLTEFVADLETFVAQYQRIESTEKVRLIIHHWLNAMAFWSMEDLTLSAATVLEIIAATAQDLGKSSSTSLTTFNTCINYAADRFSIAHLNPEFRRMRNDLVHTGHLKGNRLQRRNKETCASLISDSLNWIDEYLCETVGFRSRVGNRFKKNSFVTANAFSLD